MFEIDQTDSRKSFVMPEFLAYWNLTFIKKSTYVDMEGHMKWVKSKGEWLIIDVPHLYTECGEAKQRDNELVEDKLLWLRLQHWNNQRGGEKTGD